FAIWCASTTGCRRAGRSTAVPSRTRDVIAARYASVVSGSSRGLATTLSPTQAASYPASSAWRAIAQHSSTGGRRADCMTAPRVGIVPGAPEAGAVAGIAPVVDVQRRDPDAVPCDRLEVAHHVADARVAGDVDALAVGIGELGRDGAGQAEAERGDVAPAEEAARDLRLVDRARLVAGVAVV